MTEERESVRRGRFVLVLIVIVRFSRLRRLNHTGVVPAAPYLDGGGGLA